MLSRKFLNYFCLALFSLSTVHATSTDTAIRKKKCCVKNKRDFCESTADYIIVGLGTAGSVLARYLSDPINGKYKNSVLVLEAGQNRTGDPIVEEGPNQLFFNIDELAYNPKYSVTKICPDTNPLLGFFPNEQYSTGRQWFGSSAHNFMGAVRGSTDRWDELAAFVGNSQWTYDNLLPFMKFLENYSGTSQQINERGLNGPLLINQEPTAFLTESFPLAVSTATGAPILLDYNVESGNTAVAANQNYSTPDGNHRSYGLNFLPISILRPDGTATNGRKLRVLSGSYVNKILFEGNKAVGVEYYHDNHRVGRVAFARKKVILCAGCPFSAALLQRSGIGPEDVLQSVNIPVRVNNPLVGTGLKEHYGILYALGINHTIAQSFGSFSDGRNFFAPAGTGDGVRRFQTLYFPALGVLPPSLLSAANIDPTLPGFAGTSWFLRPNSSGTAFLVDDSPFSYPDIRFNLYSDGDLSDPSSDLSAAIAAYKIIRQIAIDSGATLLYPPPSHFASDDQLAFDAGAAINYSQLSMTNHYSGTCNMGTSINNGVISGTDLHVFGTENLMVADSSIFPFPETGNTAWQCYIAGIIAAHILGVPLPLQ